ncbi:MAG: pyruvate kinase [Alphaproteobacteria bacterium]|nr:pyruvate kinase [Alphaproteobacteria bacterium]
MKNTFTKIVCTLGPATSSEKMIKSLAKAGANVFRLNFSHGDYERHAENFQIIRQMSREQKSPYGILCDLQGPKLRVGKFKKDKVRLIPGQKFRMDMSEKLGDETRVSLMHPEIFKALKQNMSLLLNDGQIQLNVDDFGPDYVNTTVEVGGILSNHKGVNVPDVILPISALTSKDLKDLDFALKLGADWICLSFVQKPEDVKMARDIIGDKAGIIVKIEKPSALQYLKEIIELADGVMVARGDLGVECPIETVPAIQKRIIETCRAAGKPVIVATQMLESMILSPVPTRAEVSDVATAVYDGADAVMLSAETAMGEYPIKAVSMMKKIITKTSQDIHYINDMEKSTMPPDKTVASAITSAIRQMIKVLDKPACIVSYSVSGKTTLRTARERPLLPIISMTTTEAIANRMALVWGVRSVVVPTLEDLTDVIPVAVNYVKEAGYAKPDDEIIITAGIPFATHGNTNLIHIAKVG